MVKLMFWLLAFGFLVATVAPGLGLALLGASIALGCAILVAPLLR
jgi:hypothetical protein